jgi:hypothetical protein
MVGACLGQRKVERRTCAPPGTVRRAWSRPTVARPMPVAGIRTALRRRWNTPSGLSGDIVSKLTLLLLAENDRLSTTGPFDRLGAVARNTRLYEVLTHWGLTRSLSALREASNRWYFGARFDTLLTSLCHPRHSAKPVAVLCAPTNHGRPTCSRIPRRCVGSCKGGALSNSTHDIYTIYRSLLE